MMPGESINLLSDDAWDAFAEHHGPEICGNLTPDGLQQDLADENQDGEQLHSSQSLADVLASMPDVGEDSDFEPRP